MASPQLKDRIAALVVNEQRGARTIGNTVPDDTTAISRAANIGARIAVKFVSEQDLAATGNAATLGGRLATTPDRSMTPFGRVRIEPVSDVERQARDFGDLPDQLLYDAKGVVGQLLPETGPIETAYRLAGRTMSIVQSKPGINGHVLREQLAALNAERPLFAPGQDVPLSDAIILDGVITIAHEVAAGYFTPAQRGAVNGE